MDRWREAEMPTDDPDETARRFTQLVDDLAYAKTFYPRSNTVRYINNLASKLYLQIYGKRKEKGNRFVSFWTEELPLILYRCRRELVVAALFFIVCICLGIFSASHDQSFMRAVLGDNYIDMTERNIAKGDPFHVYKDENPFVMFIYIGWNNIGVAFKTFIGGILGTLGTFYLLFHNGIMVGVFEYLFYKHGLGLQFILTVFIHGTLELSAAVISGAAGLRLGNALLFPKTYTRMQSLKLGAKDGIKITIGLIPIFIVAAFFESYLTRHTEMPVIASIGVLAASLFFIIWYFAIYPARVAPATEADMEADYEA
jgi:uncharacterized membrane protein SpoIIM required for sporulation